jgi:predicted aminopeptidase
MKIICSKFLRVSVVLLGIAQLTGCGLGYYWQAATGHLSLMRERRPVAEVLEDSATPPELRAKLEIADDAVDFAHQALLLPDNGSYRSYVDIDREHVVWNVFAAPEFSLEPREWCFPVAGCVSYRGYFDVDKAQGFADRLAANGDDVFVGGVTAYSTLGRFDDPVLSTMTGLPAYALAGLIFHELAHQRVYAKGDSQFNEGFASFVEREGLRRWLRSIGDEESQRRASLSLDRLNQVQNLLVESGAILNELYARDIDDGAKRAAKKDILSGVRLAYRDMRRAWDGPPYFDHWFDERLNNARVAAVSIYDDDVPAFRALMDSEGGDLQSFYAKAAVLAALSPEDRTAAMSALRPDGDAR